MRSHFSTTFLTVTGGSVAVALLGLLAACSGTSTGTGTGTSGGTSGSGGKGFLGGGASAGGGSAVPTSCSASSADDTCTACLKAQCCTQTLDCSNNAECVAIVSCAESCDTSSTTCIQGCVSAHPSGQTNIQTLVSCEEASCQAACGDSSSSTSGGTTSGGTVTGDSGASNGCLADTPQDPTLCPNLPGKQVVKDCPSGPPSPDCVFNPMGLSGLYCCPN